jgi:hypothetical protein
VVGARPVHSSSTGTGMVDVDDPAVQGQS